MPDRREFIQTTCTACGAILTLSLSDSILTGCKSSALAKDNLPPFTIVNGELSLQKSSITYEGMTIKPENSSREVFIRKNQDDSLTAFILRCTHANGRLTPVEQGFSCNLHGSFFAMDGKVIKGPAKEPLKNLPVKIEGELIKILID